MKEHRNWFLWAGFLVAVAGFASYFLFFARFPSTRDIPWLNLLFFLVAALLLIVGLRRAFARESSYRGRVSGPILAVLSTAILMFFCFGVFVESRELPPSTDAPRVGQKAPPFSLPDTSGREESLSELLSSPIADGSPAGHTPKGVLLVFYRGYW